MIAGVIADVGGDGIQAADNEGLKLGASLPRAVTDWIANGACRRKVDRGTCVRVAAVHKTEYVQSLDKRA